MIADRSGRGTEAGVRRTDIEVLDGASGVRTGRYLLVLDDGVLGDEAAVRDALRELVGVDDVVSTRGGSVGAADARPGLAVLIAELGIVVVAKAAPRRCSPGRRRTRASVRSSRSGACGSSTSAPCSASTCAGSATPPTASTPARWSATPRRVPCSSTPRS
jgi:hypothetical protein